MMLSGSTVSVSDALVVNVPTNPAESQASLAPPIDIPSKSGMVRHCSGGGGGGGPPPPGPASTPVRTGKLDTAVMGIGLPTNMPASGVRSEKLHVSVTCA